LPTYTFTARDARGASVTGFQDASNEVEAVKILQGRGLVVTDVRLPLAAGAGRKSKRRLHKGIRTEDFLIFTRETATLLEAGIPLLRTLEVINEQIESIRLRATIAEMIAQIKAGSTLKDAVAAHPKIFPNLWVHLIEAGEVSGNLTTVLAQIADHLESSIGLRKRLVSALTYPAVLVFIAIIAVVVFLVKIIPVFDNLFTSMNAKLPALTLVVIKFSRVLQNYFLVVVALLGGVAFFVRQYLATPGGRRNLDSALLRMPLFGPLFREMALARIAINLTTLIRSGVNIVQSVEITSRAAGNMLYQDSLERVRVEIQQGKTLSSAMSEDPLFSSMMVNMIMIGEESGKLADMMGRVSHYYQDRVEVFLDRLGTLIEPLVMVVIGSIIAFLVIAMFLPILSLSQIVK
jgi:type IV pilus assembly protein PilC